jgi:Na+/proline symporter
MLSAARANPSTFLLLIAIFLGFNRNAATNSRYYLVSRDISPPSPFAARAASVGTSLAARVLI